MLTCVIGGSGFIGRHLVDTLIATGREVMVLGRRKLPALALNPRALYFQCDYENKSALRPLLQQCDEVIDLAYATVPQTSFVDPLFDLQANLPACIGLLEEARHLRKLRKLVIISSGGTVYGQVNHLPITEDAANNPVSPYGITKLTIERYALMYKQIHDVPCAIVRPSNAYGLGQVPFTGQGFIATAIGTIAQHKPVIIYSECGTIRDYVHVKDVAKGILAVLDNGTVGEIYNIGSGVGRNNLEVLDVIAEFARQDNYEVTTEVAPSRKFDVRANILDCGRLHRCSGWLPEVSFEEGVAEMWTELSKSH